MKAQQIVLAKRPEGLPKQEDFRLEQTIVSDELQPEQLLLKARYISVDPYLRGLMNEPRQPGAGIALNTPVVSAVIAEVVGSKADGFIAGDLVLGHLPWSTYTIAGKQQVQKIEASEVPPSAFLGLLGMPGLTGYFGLLEIGKPQNGETVVISGAAGAIGTIIGQVAKLKGCRVVGLAGADEKAQVLKAELGYDEVINYKTANLGDALKAACPKGVDVYFDNTGGPISDTVMQQLNLYARVVVCGQIATYNQQKQQPGISLLPLILNKSITVQGYHAPAFQARFPEAVQQLSVWYQEGKIKSKETILKGFEKLPEAFMGLFTGKNLGKMLVEI